MKTIFKANQLVSLTEGGMELMLRIYADDIRLAYEEKYEEGDYTREYWIGEKGTAPIHSMHVWTDDGKFNCEVICFGKTMDELRKDETFIRALMTDGDVNHALVCSDGKDYPDNESAKEILKWLSGETNEMFISACGAINYYDAYLAE